MNIKRPKEVEELIRTLNPEVPYKEFEAARGVHELEAIINYVFQLEGNQREKSDR